MRLYKEKKKVLGKKDKNKPANMFRVFLATVRQFQLMG